MVAQKVHDESHDDDRIIEYIAATEELKRGNFDIRVPLMPPDKLGRLGRGLQELAVSLEQRYKELNRLNQITLHINSGLLLEDVLHHVYEDFRDFIPYNRIGIALVNGDEVIARWAHSDQPEIKLEVGYTAPLAGSSLQTILETGQPRIINDLQKYLEAKPDSESTRYIVGEGLRSSLTCPLIANSVPVGFIFFSSIEPNAYSKAHVETFQSIANQLSLIVEKSWLMSELVRQKSELELQNVELTRLQDIKNTFLGIAAHDLRNPLAAIMMSMQLLANSDESIFSPQDVEIIEEAQRQSRYMRALLNDLLSVSELESGRFTITKDEIDVNGFLEESVRRHRMMAASKHISVTLEPVPPGVVYADSMRLHQVIDNLISNAIKYSDSNKVVSVVADFDSVGWCVQVRDEGPGIDPQHIENLFKDFSRGSAKPTDNERSTGLGLAITRRIIEAHGGEVGVNSKVGEGATFWFTLPHTVTR